MKILIFILVLVFSRFAYGEEIKDGIYKEYFPDGKVMSEGNYSDGKKQGLFKEYTQDGRLIWERNYKDDKADGIAKKYYESGQLNTESYFSNGRPVDVSKEYYQSQALQRTLDYRNYKKGIVIITEYYETGNIFAERRYKDNLLVSAKGYDEEGKIILDEKY